MLHWIWNDQHRKTVSLSMKTNSGAGSQCGYPNFCPTFVQCQTFVQHTSSICLCFVLVKHLSNICPKNPTFVLSKSNLCPLCPTYVLFLSSEFAKNYQTMGGQNLVICVVWLNFNYAPTFVSRSDMGYYVMERLRFVVPLPLCGTSKRERGEKTKHFHHF